MLVCVCLFVCFTFRVSENLGSEVSASGFTHDMEDQLLEEVCGQEEDGNESEEELREEGSECDDPETGKEAEKCTDLMREDERCGMVGSRWAEIQSREKNDKIEDEKDSEVSTESCLTRDYGSGHESVSSSNCTTSTTTSYLHGDRVTVQRMVARGLRKKQKQNQRRVGPKKNGKTGGEKNKTKSSELQWALESGW